MRGHTFKRCTCRVRRDEAGNKVTCQRQHGSWSYVADLPQQPGERRRQQTKGGFGTRREAESALQEFIARAQRGQVVAPVRLTVEAYLIDWVEAVAPSLAVTASSNYRLLIRCYVVPHVGQYKLTALHPEHLVKAYRALLAGGGRDGRALSATTVRLVHRIVSKALADAVRDGLLVRNPATNVPLPKAVRRDLPVWTRQQVAAFLPAAAQDRLYAAWMLALLCGLRRGELAGLRWSDVDLAGRTIRVTNQRTTDAAWQVVTKEPKGTSRRTIDLGPVLAAGLLAHQDQTGLEQQQAGAAWTDSELVFVQPDGSGYHPDRLRRLFQIAARRAGVPVIRLHDARHSCATLALDAGLHPKVVQQLLGHSSWGVTMDLYSHRVERLQREASARLEGLVIRVGSVSDGTNDSPSTEIDEGPDAS